MGASYGKGYITALVEYLISKGLSRTIIEFEADFGPYQPSDQKAVDGIPTYQISYGGDSISGNEPVDGAIIVDTSSESNQGHKLKYFLSQIAKLPSGYYSFDLVLL